MENTSDPLDPLGDRLDALRQAAAAQGRVAEVPGGPILGAPFPLQPTSEGYYGRPLLKPPVWTWEVPSYFFVGGAAGAAAVIAVAAGTFGADPEVARHARFIAAAGAVLSPPLLISDLGRPSRFLNMLRVFKHQSPMSVGAWTLALFSTAAVASVGLEWLRGSPLGDAHGDAPWLTFLAMSADLTSALFGLVLATYTGVLIGATAIPVWSRHVRLLPFHFGASALGAAVSLVELMGHRTSSLNRAGIGAASVETLIALLLALRPDAASRPLVEGRSGLLTRLGSGLSGPIPLVLRLFAASSPLLRSVAAVATILGSLITRFGWIAAGRASAADAALPLELDTPHARHDRA